MSELKLIDKNAYKEVESFLNDVGVELDERAKIANSNFCSIVSDFCKNKIEARDILEMYDYVTDVLCGRRLKVVIHVPREDRIIWAKKLIKQVHKYELDDQEIEFFAFGIVFSFFVHKGTGEANDSEPSIFEFTTKEHIIKQYKWYKKENYWKFNLEEYSDPERYDYGYSIDNPIEVMTVSLAYAYLNDLVTSDDEEIRYARLGSFRGEDGILIDGYEIFIEGVFGEKKIATLYINSYGMDNSVCTPKGFKFRSKI